MRSEPKSGKAVSAAQEIESGMHTEWAGRRLVYFESTDSTNVQAKLLAEQGAAHGTLVVAEEQTAGRGRKGRDWISPAGSNLYFTLLLRPDCAPDCAPMLTLVMALAVSEAIQQVCGVNAGIKWPNDLVAEQKKLTGILTEMELEGRRIRHVVIGVGVNVKKQSFPDELTERATTLEAAAGKPVARRVLLEKIMQRFETAYRSFLRTGELSLLQKEYNSRLVNCGRQVRVLDPAGEYSGVAEGINERGELLVRTADGGIRQVYAGEVSVRGIYGYV